MMCKKFFLLLCLIFLYNHAHDYIDLVQATVWADYLCYDKQHARADDWYHDAIGDKTVPYPLRSYALYLFDTHQYKNLLSYQKQLREHFNDDLSVQKALAIALAHEKYDAQSEELFVRLATQFPTSYDVVLPASQILMRRGADAQAQGMLERIINTRTQRQVTALCMVLLAQLYIKTQNIDGAYALMMQCTTSQPTYAPAWLILGMLEELKQNRESAVQAYRMFVQLSPMQVPDIQKRIVQLTTHSSVLSNNQLVVPANEVQTIMFLIAQKKYTEALSASKKIIARFPADATVRALHVHLLVINGAYQSALALLANYIHEQPDDYRWWGALHILALHQQAFSVAAATLEQLQRQYVCSVWGYLYTADMAMRLGNFNKAHALCAQACVISTQDVMLSELYFMQALCGYELHDYQKVAHAIKKGLATSVIHAPLYNLAAYYYAHIGEYARAQQLIVQCCALEPHNYHYHDTAAFIVYKKNDLDAAHKVLNALHAQYGTDAMISLHAASVAHKKANLTGARALLAQAGNHAYSEYVKRRIESYLKAGNI